MVCERPVVLLSAFKSGTHALRWVLEALTGLACFEPPIVPGRVDYNDPAQLVFKEGHFYSWHLVIGNAVCARLRTARARPVFLLRNMYDLAVSMYHHFALNIDADIGRGRDVHGHFAELSVDEGLTAIIEGMRRSDFLWRGLGPHLQQMERMLRFAAAYPCFVTTYEKITGAGKREELERLARFLELDRSAARLDQIERESSFARMRARAIEAGGGSHYRRGQAGSHNDELAEDHRAATRAQLASWAPALGALADRAGVGEVVR